MHPIEYTRYQCLFRGSTEHNKTLINDLMRGGFIIDDQIDEISILRLRNRIARYKTNVLGLTIAPTLDCNFQCQYCFQDRRPIYMKREVVEAVVEFVTRKFRQGVKELNVTWYGGEPFLPKAEGIIQHLTQTFNELCKTYSVSYSFGLVTNGSLLYLTKIKKLLRNPCSWVQITIDGPPLVHNYRRPFRNGQGSFNQILNNIKKIKGLG